MVEIALLDNRGQPFPSHEREPLSGFGLHPVDIYRLPETDLTPFAGLIIGGASDQEFLYKNRHIIEGFLNCGRVVAFSGHLLRPWLPGCGLFVPKQIRSFKDYTVHLTGEHPIFAGVDPQELTFRRGVAGFFSRGHHPAPEGVEVLAHLGPDEPIVYVDRVTTPGVILAHCGNDLLGFGDGGTADRIVPQLLDWIRDQSSVATPAPGIEGMAPDRDAATPGEIRPNDSDRDDLTPPVGDQGALARVGAVYNGSSAHHRVIHQPKYARWLAGAVYLPDLPEADLDEFDALLVAERSHRGLLERSRSNLLRFLERGGTLVVFGDQSVYGPQPSGWLPGIDWEDGTVNYWWWRQPDPQSGLTAHLSEHSLWRYLDLAAATWHQHGGFRPPPGAEVLITNAEGLAILYVDRLSTPGTLVVTSLDPMYHYGSHFMPATERFLDGFLPWLATEMPVRDLRVADREGAL